MNRFPNYIQKDTKDCGPTCLKIIAKHYNKNLNIQALRELSETTREGSNLLKLSEGAEIIGFRSLGVKISLLKLIEAPLPCVLHWNKNHYVVLYGVKRKKSKVEKLLVSDPAFGLLQYSAEEFLKFWIGNNADENSEEGIALLLEPTPAFYEQESYNEEKKGYNLSYLSKYLIRYKSFIVQLTIGLLAGSILQLIFPFLTQSIVDVGIQNQNIHFIWLVLIAQLFL